MDLLLGNSSVLKEFRENVNLLKIQNDNMSKVIQSQTELIQTLRKDLFRAMQAIKRSFDMIKDISNHLHDEHMDVANNVSLINEGWSDRGM